MGKFRQCAGIRVEALESRKLLTATLGSDGVLTVNGTNGADSIEFDRRTSTQFRVEMNDAEQSFNDASITRVVVFAGNGNDFVEFNDRNLITIRSEIHGGNGNDHLEGSPGADTIYGEAGNDVLEGKAGSDSLVGANGNDTLEGSTGNDVLKGGNHNDVLEGGLHNDRMFGGAGEDDLQGNSGADRIFGEAGNDDFDNSDAGEIFDRTSEDNGANSNVHF